MQTPRLSALLGIVDRLWWCYVINREECAKPPYKVPKGYEPPPRLSDHVCAKLDECERFVGDRCEHLGFACSITTCLQYVAGICRSNIGHQSDMRRCRCRVHDMEQFEGDVARVRVDSRKPAQTMTTEQLLKLEL